MRKLFLLIALPVFVACSNEESGNLATSEIGMNAEVQFTGEGNNRSAIAQVRLYEGIENKPSGSGASFDYTRAVELTDGDQLYVVQNNRKEWLSGVENDGNLSYMGTLNNIDYNSPIFIQLRRNNEKTDAFDTWITVPSNFQLEPNSIYQGRLSDDITLYWSQVNSSHVRYQYQLTCHYQDEYNNWLQSSFEFVSSKQDNTGTLSFQPLGVASFEYCNGEVGIVAEVNGIVDSRLYSTSTIRALVTKTKPIILTR